MRYLLIVLLLITTPVFAQIKGIKPVTADMIGVEADDGKIITAVESKSREEIVERIDRLTQDITDRMEYVAKVQSEIDAWVDERERLQGMLDTLGTPAVVEEEIQP